MAGIWRQIKNIQNIEIIKTDIENELLYLKVLYLVLEIQKC